MNKVQHFQLEIICHGFILFEKPDAKEWGYYDPKFGRSYIYMRDFCVRFFEKNIFDKNSEWVMLCPKSDLILK